MASDDGDPGGHRLELREEEGGPRYYLAGRPVDDGAIVFVLWDSVYVRWYPARFRWSGARDETPQILVGAVPREYVPKTIMPGLWKPGLRMRWPSPTNPAVPE